MAVPSKIAVLVLFDARLSAVVHPRLAFPLSTKASMRLLGHGLD